MLPIMIEEVRREFVLGAMLVVALVLLPARPRERVRVVTETSVRVVLVPAVVPYERIVNVPAQRAACPLERTDAPRVQPAQPAEYVDHLQPSKTNAGWIAAWSEQYIFISMDSGASWQRVLDGKGNVRDVDFDCYGNAIAVRGDRVGIARAGVETWHAVPGIALRDLSEEQGDEYTIEARAFVLGGGPDIAIMGNIPDKDDPWKARLVVSRDAGETFLQRDLTEGWQSNAAGRQYADGSIVAMVPQSDCGGDSPWMFRFENDTVTSLSVGTSADLEIFGNIVVGEDGWHRIGAEEALPIEGIEGHVTVLAGPSPILVKENKLYRFANGKATPLPWRISDEAQSLTVDRAGRVWSIACHQLHIATKDAPPICDCDAT